MYGNTNKAHACKQFALSFSISLHFFPETNVSVFLICSFTKWYVLSHTLGACVIMIIFHLDYNRWCWWWLCRCRCKQIYENFSSNIVKFQVSHLTHIRVAQSESSPKFWQLLNSFRLIFGLVNNDVRVDSWWDSLPSKSQMSLPRNFGLEAPPSLHSGIC